MPLMGLLSRFGLKNKNSKHYQKNYEQEKSKANDVNDEDSIKIDMGSRGQVTVTKEDRTSYYNKVREKITQRDLETIRDISLTSRTINDAFRRMEHTDLPLEYLVALGRVEEVDVEAYQNLKVKGLDLQNTLEASELEGIDETLKMQVFSQAKELPKLKQTTIIPEEEPTPIDPNIFRQEYEEQQEEQEEEIGENKDEGQDKEQDETAEDKVEENNNEDPTINKLRSLAETLKKQQSESKEETIEPIGPVEVVTPKRKVTHRVEDRTVYVIADRVLMPVIKGYNVVKVETMREINQFTSSKRDLLVISQNIPAAIQNTLLNWLQGVAGNETKYRIVTLEGLEVTHDLIETTVSLDGDSINKYYEDYPDDRYGGKDVRSFRDISYLLNEGDTK